MPDKLFGFFASQNIPDEYKEEFRREVKNTNLLRLTTILSIIILIELMVIVVVTILRFGLFNKFYIQMSLILIVISLVSILLLRFAGNKFKDYVEFLVIFSLLLWSVVYALIDRHSLGFIGIYMGITMLLSVMYIGPRKIIAATFAAEAVFLGGYIYLNPDVERICVNGTNTFAFVLISWFLSRWFYSSFSYNFVSNKLLHDKNDELEEAKRKIEEEAVRLNVTNKRVRRLLDLREDILEVNQHIMGSQNMKEVYSKILDKAIKNIDGASLGSILIVSGDGTLRPAAYKGYDDEKMSKFNIRLDESFAWEKTNGNIQSTIMIRDLDELNNVNVVDTVSNNEKWAIKSSLAAPIIINSKIYGLINIDSRDKNAFTSQDLELLEYFRSQIEIAITKQELYEETIYISRYDKLTDLYNRRYFEEYFVQALEKVSVDGESLNLVLIDINGLKATNDNYGHLAGDEYIRTFAKVLKDNVSDSNIVARIGGDEFAVIFINYSGVDIAERFEKIQREFSKNPIEFDGEMFKCSFSYGIANFPDEGATYKEMIRSADERMYKYKRENK